MVWHSSAHAANGIRVIGCGPVQRAMGGVSVGLPLDAAVTVTNPAGITELGGRADMGLTVAVGDSKYHAESALGQITNDGVTMTSGTPPFLLPAVGIVVPWNEDLSFGLGFYATAGVGVDYPRNLYLHVTYVKYTMCKIAPAIAYSLGDLCSVGFAPNISYATLGYEASTAATNPAHNDTTSYGFGFTVGALFHLEQFMPWDLPKDFLSLGVAYESKQWFYNFKYNTTSGQDELELEQPQVITVGIGLKPDERLRGGFDFSWINWSQVLGKDMPAYKVLRSASSEWNADWDDQFVYKMGVEYDVLEKKFVEKVTLRAGYNYGRRPLKSCRPFEDIALPAILEHHVTCGMGVDFTENLGGSIGFVWAPRMGFDAANVSDFINSSHLEVSAYSIDAGVTYRF